jgi:hypothetical protein
MINRVVIGISLIKRKYTRECLAYLLMTGCDVRISETCLIITSNRLKERFCELEQYVEGVGTEPWYKTLKEVLEGGAE